MTDAIIIGAGHNGLVAACRLAKAGRKVTVLEAREFVGGLCAEETFFEGYRSPGLHHDTSGLRAGIIDSLGLESHGLKLLDDQPIFIPGDKGVRVGKTSVEGVDEKDQEAYRTWRAFIDRLRPFLSSINSRVSPPLNATTTSDLLDLGKHGWALRRLGKDDMLEVLRIVPMCAADWLNENFADERLSECLAAPAVVGNFMGPWSAGSAATLLFHECTRERPVVGGPKAITAALLAACERLNVEVRTGAKVERIRIEQGAVAGVTLASNETLDARLVASACDPKQTFLRLISPRHLPLKLEEQMINFRTRGTTAVMRLALNAPLFGEEEVVRLGGGTLDDLERAFDAAKYREIPQRPHLDVRVPSLSDPTLAPEGHHVATVMISFVPYDLDGGWNDERRAELSTRVLETLGTAVDRLSDKIVGQELLTPVDLESRYGLTGGHIFHGEHALDQLLFMRPSPSTARYATPIPGLFLAGGGSHPGGGVSGAPGALAADVMLKS